MIFLALEGEGPDEMALAFALLYPTFNSIMATPMWILNDLFVLERARRKGLARALIARGKRLAEDTGAQALSLSTAVDNTASRELYESLGFTLDEDFCTYLLRLGDLVG